MLTWKQLCEFWKMLKAPKEEKQKTEEELIKERLGDYLDNISNTYDFELSAADKEKYARESFQRNIPNKSYKKIAVDGKILKEKIALDSNYEVDVIKNMMSSVVPDVIYKHFARQGFIGWEACSVLKQNWIINNACNIPPQDAIRPGYKLSLPRAVSSVEEAQGIEAFKSLSIKKYKILDICARAVEKKKVFGSCLVFPRFHTDIDMAVPFNPDAVSKDSYAGLVVVEPRWLNFDFDEESLTNPMSQYFYEPTWFTFNGRKIHRSWCIHLKNTVVPDVLKPSYFYGGIPLTQMLYQRVYAAEKIANEAPMLAMSKRLLVVDMPLTQKLFNPQETEKNLNQIINFRDNWGVISKRPGEGIQQIDTSLADFESVLMSQYQLVAAIAQMPATKLLKAQPTGMNATGEYDFKDYIQSLETIQDNDMKPIIDLHNKLLSLSLEKNYDFLVSFNPIDVPTKMELAQVNSAKAQILNTLVAGGIISQDEARNVLRSDEESDFAGLAEAPQEANPQEETEIQNLMEKMRGQNVGNINNETSNA